MTTPAPPPCACDRKTTGERRGQTVKTGKEQFNLSDYFQTSLIDSYITV